MLHILQKTFKGGIHPPENKDISAAKPIERLPLPGYVVIPLQQHIGKLSEALVQAGDDVVTGQPVSKASGFVSLPSHSSISGKVKSIESFPHPLGQKVPSVIIEGDGEDRMSEQIKFQADYMSLPPDEMKRRITEAGIAGMGGATFPTHVKLSPPQDKPIDTVILNGAECEPYLTADHRLMIEHTEEIVEGFRIILRILGVSRGIIAIEKNKPDAIFLFEKFTKDDPNLELLPLKVKYPQGAEKQLIFASTGRRVPAGKLPMEVRCLVHNVGTAKAIYEAVAYQKPLIERVVTVTGAVKEPKNIRARIGTPLRNLIEFCGGFVGTPGKVIMGGPMMGVAQYTIDVPVIKGTSGVVVLPSEQVREMRLQPCINCGRCVKVCPMNIMPNLAATYIENNLWEEAKSAGALDCMECGSCGYVCPAGRNILHNIRFGKFMILEQEKASKN
ncbi:electron transporter RnfC [bacterium SM23_31]|nr:MAG: electron transporter RnfC [bacterium SM23_31]